MARAPTKKLPSVDDPMTFELYLLTTMLERVQGKTPPIQAAAMAELRRLHPLLKTAIRGDILSAETRDRFRTYDRTLDHGFGRVAKARTKRLTSTKKRRPSP
jgi:hypothetical protein